jgi:septum formation protein
MASDMNAPKLILASASPRRSELLRQIHSSFTVAPSNAEELHDPVLSAVELCEINARRKAEEVAARFPDGVVLGADTLVAKGNQIFGKPKDVNDARRMLRELSGCIHEVVTGVCLIHKMRAREELFADVTRVTFRTLSAAVIDDYLSLVNVLDKAGAYALQEHGSLIIDCIEGSRSNVIGLPIEKLERALNAFGL